MNTLKPWREVAIPHDDVLKGIFQQAEFAADLSAVQQNRASEEYQDPRKFFERTFITEGMRLLLENIVRRLTGQGGDPVIQLQTSFGGGKTHTMLAVYHLASRSIPASELRGIQPILDAASGNELPPARVAILDGNALGPNEARQRGGLTVRTLWGELAWQLGGEEAYSMLRLSDESGTSPGKETLVNMLGKFSPSVILIDELVAYIRQLSQDSNNNIGGSYDANLSFVQALTEAAKQVPTCCILASLPESELEAGGERGQQVLDALSKIFGRVQALWKPVSSEEAFEIVRRRLFKSDLDQSLVQASCNGFFEIYSKDALFPNETRETQYRERMERSYPVHPELLDLLYENWSSLEKFQRTRGVLKLMAKVIHRLWKDGNSDILITPGSLPLYDIDIRTELINYLPNGWEQIIEGELDGEKSKATELDASNHFGSIEAARRIARALFLSTAPLISNQANRGIEVSEIMLAVLEPGQQVGWFKDALNQLNDRLHYLNHSGARYFLDTRPNLRRNMEDRRSNINNDEISAFIRTTLQRQINVPLFDGVHVFIPHHDIPDDTSLRLVVLPDKATYFTETNDSEAIREAKTYLKKRGEQPRMYANRLIFMVADQGAAGNMRLQIKTSIAWQSLVADAAEARLNLDQYQLKQARQSQEVSTESARHAILETYRWLLIPTQTASQGNASDIKLEIRQIAGTAVSNEIERVLKEHEDVITAWAPIHLANILKQWYWIKQPHVNARMVWEDLCKYPYLPRLRNASVFEQMLSQAATGKETFGFAYDFADEYYVDAHLGDGCNVMLDSALLLVEPSVLSLQIKAGLNNFAPTGDENKESPIETDQWAPPKPGTFSQTRTEASGNVPHRFVGRKELVRTASAPMDFKELYDEVIAHLSKVATNNVKISVDIQAESSQGFDEQTQRIVRENSKLLGCQVPNSLDTFVKTFLLISTFNLS